MSATKGHDSHSGQFTGSFSGGEFPRKIKVLFLGAGSFFAPRLISDILLTPGYCGGEFALVDVDEDRLKRVRAVIEWMVRERGLEGEVTVTASVNRRELMEGTDYAISCVEVAGLVGTQSDYQIPLEYGVAQCIGDTIGPGGLFKALRTVPVWLDILSDMEELCPGALMLNYTNPMNVLCLAAFRCSNIPVVGLCHSVQGTGKLLAQRAGVPYEAMNWECAGINHLAWFTRLEHDGKDLYPRLKENARAALAGTPQDPADASDLIRREMMLQFGAFITESSGHLSEYLPYFRKRQDLREFWFAEEKLKSGYDGRTGFYASEWPTWRANKDKERDALLSGQGCWDFNRSHEYGSFIIEAREKNVPFAFHGNVYNGSGGQRLISNLADDSCVEVKVIADRNGLNPTRFGALPKVMAHLCASNQAMFDLAADACIHRDKELAVQALMLDPLTAAVCQPSEIREMTERLFAAQQQLLPGF